MIRRLSAKLRCQKTEEAAELLDDFLVFALCESDLCDVVAPALPDELLERIDRRIQAFCEEPRGQPCDADRLEKPAACSRRGDDNR